MEDHGPALAIGLSRSYRMSDPVPLGAGDLLVLATDGITEAMRRDRQLYGEPRFRETIRSLRDGMAEEIVAGVVHSVETFLEGGDLTDDLTMVAMKVGKPG
jgi:sigma-B regulation protein RsbU (phosphoserine phosphatase)